MSAEEENGKARPMEGVEDGAATEEVAPEQVGKADGYATGVDRPDGGDGSARDGEQAAPGEDRSGKDRDRGRRDSHGKRDRDDKERKEERKSSRRSRSRDGSKERRRRSRSRDRDRGKGSSRRSPSATREKGRSSRRRSRSKSRDRKSSRRSRSRDRRRSRSRDRRRSRSKERPVKDGHTRRSRSASSSDSGYGGYKPRKRQEPIITNGPGTGADPFASMRAAPVSHDPQAAMRQWQLQQLEARAMVLDQQAKSAATATSKTQREVYVGGLGAGAISSEALRTLFNSALAVQFAGTLMPGMDPVININMHPEGKYAFVEFRTPDMATAALALSGQVQLMGITLSVARPSGYVDPVKAAAASQAASAALAAFKKGDMQALAAAALAGANLKGLGLAAHIEDPAAAAAPQLPPGVTVDGLSGMPTTCLCFIGMVTAERLKDDQEYNDMMEDLKEQFNDLAPAACDDIKVPRPYDPALADQYIGIANYGKIFAKLKTPDAAQVCRDRIHGRMYGGQPVQVYYITEEAYGKV